MTYSAYHEAVANECVALMSGSCRHDDGSIMSDEELRAFFGKVCSYEDEFAEGIPPSEVAEAQWEAIT